MHLIQLRRFLVVALAATLLLALPSEAKRRSVRKGPAGGSLTVDINGTVLDNATGAPVIGASVRVGGVTRITDEQGHFTFRGVTGSGTILVEASRTGYTTSSTSLTTSGTHNITLRLNPQATVSVRRADGTTVQLDADTIEFGYPVPFSGYYAAPFEDFCTPTGQLVEIDRSEISRINGPATPESFPACCPGAETLKINITLKNGTTSNFFFVDACNGYTNIDLIGRNHATAQKVFIPVSTIGEVVFP